MDKLYIHTCGNPFLTIIEILKAGHVKERGFIELTVCVLGGRLTGLASVQGPLLWSTP